MAARLADANKAHHADAQRFATTFFEYERDNNIFLNALRQNNDLLAIVQYIVDKETAALLVPHSAILEGAVISAPFVQAHTIVLNPENAKQFLTLNGLFGAFVKITVAVDEEEERSVHVLKPDAPPAEPLNPLVDVPSYFHSVKGCFETATSVRSIPVLREGEISLRGKTVSIFIIAEPLVGLSESEHKPPPAVAAPPSSSAPIPISLSNEVVMLTPLPPSDPVVIKPTAPVQLKDVLVNTVNTGLFPESPVEVKQARPKKDPFLDRLKQAPQLYQGLQKFIDAFQAKMRFPPEEQRDQFRTFVQRFEAAMWAHPLWRNASAEEADAASEALERLLTMRLYTKIFGTLENSEKDKALHLRMQHLHFIRTSHLDITVPDLEKSAQFELATEELSKINSFKAPRDKLVCIFNCCKVVYKLLKKSDSNPAGADDFLPLLIFITLKANPVNLHANMLYISHFRAPEKMNTEAGYYYTHLFSAITFIEIMDAKSISIDPAEFDRLMKMPLPKKTAASAPVPAATAATAAPLSTSPSSLGYIPLAVSSVTPTAPPASDLMSFDALPLSMTGSPAIERGLSSATSASLSPRGPDSTAPPSASVPSSTSAAPPSASLLPSMQAASASHASSPVLRTSSSVASPPPSPTPSFIDFATATEADLKMEHIPLLLDAYKQLLSENKGLRLLLQEHGIGYQ